MGLKTVNQYVEIVNSIPLCFPASKSLSKAYWKFSFFNARKYRCQAPFYLFSNFLNCWLAELGLPDLYFLFFFLSPFLSLFLSFNQRL